jgi:2-polyprenyl-6-methoxyphenol hydroxylase-like FAD-dependent oxidoreductase
VIERQTALPPGNRRITIQPNGLAVLERLGALERVRERGTRVDALVFVTRSETTLAVYRFAELDARHPYAVTISPTDLQRSLLERLSELGGDPVVGGAEFRGVLRDGTVRGLQYTEADGAEVDVAATCVVGADGAGSRVRQELGIPTLVGRSADAYVVGIGATPTGLRPGKARIYCARGWHNGVVPTEDGCYFWDHVTPENRAPVEAGDLGTWKRHYEQRVPVGREIVAPLERWDELGVLTLRKVRARQRVVAGAALVGDAAGTVHPAVSQGANLALEDAVALGDVLARYRGSAPISRAALEEYVGVRDRKLRVYQAWSYFSAGCLDSPNQIWRLVGLAGLGLARIPWVRRRQLRMSAGLEFGPRRPAAPAGASRSS